MNRSLSQFGNGGGSCSGEDGIMLFGVRLGESTSFKKSVSMINLSQYDQVDQTPDLIPDSGYASDDVVHASGRNRERKRGVPWTEEEHKLFLLGLQKVGKGDWRGISRNFVKTRTPTQVASHAQKYFLRRNNQNRRRRRSSLFDITTTDSYGNSSMEEDIVQEEPPALPPQQPHSSSSNLQGYSSFTLLPVIGENLTENLTLGTTPSKQPKWSPKPIRPIPLLPVPSSSKMADLSLNSKTSSLDPLILTLKLSTPSTEEQSPQQQPHTSSSFEAMSSGDSIISVA